MLKKLTKHGNSLALVIDRPILELLNIDPDTPLDVSTDGRETWWSLRPNRRRAGRSSKPRRNWRISDTAKHSANSLSKLHALFRGTGVSDSGRGSEVHEQQIEIWRVSPACAMPPGCRRRSPHHRRHSAANSCIHPFPPWRRRTFSISARTTPSLTGTNRFGANAAITFLLMNDWEPTFDEEGLVDLVLAVASGRLGKPALTGMFASWCKPVDA